MRAEQKRAFNFVMSLRDFYGDYHAKKEREAYFVAVLYLGASVAFLTRKWQGPEKLLLVGFIAATFVAVALVAFQLYNRWFAARMVAACTTVASRWLVSAPTPRQYRPAQLGPAEWPEHVVEVFREKGAIPPLASLILIPALLLVWGAAVVIWEVCK